MAVERAGRIYLPLILAAVLVFMLAGQAQSEEGLLFHLSADRGFTADFAKGNPEPTMFNDISIVKDGAVGRAFSNPHFTQLFAYECPKNMYAERGTFAFFWRPRDPVGKTPFHIVQGGFIDGSDILSNWMRIDYNEDNGIDAFVTDVNLARIRAHYERPEPFDKDTWYHIALTWDETAGVRLYLDGRLVAQKDTVTVLYAGIDQWGTGARGVSPTFVGSEGNFMRGGDYDEYRIYDRMLPDDQVARLAKGKATRALKPMNRNLGDPATRDEWLLRYGWNRADDIPPELYGKQTIVRKVEVEEAYDLKQWWWKGNDGVRETVWPSLFNRSSLPGHNDYMIQPDWNCYSLSGKSITFTMPGEPWNHIEIAGAAFGKATAQVFDRERNTTVSRPLFRRPANQERSSNRLGTALNGGSITFTNDVREMAIGEFMVYNVSPGREPDGTITLSYRLDASSAPDNSTLAPLLDYIDSRFMPDERTTMLALPAGIKLNPKEKAKGSSLPLIHVLIPSGFRGTENPVKFLGWYAGGGSRRSYTWDNIQGGLDGIAIDIPALDVTATHGELFPMNIQVKDPVWPDRNLFDFTFSVRPGEAKTIFMDTRDRVLPNGRPLYLTIAGAGQDLTPELLDGGQIRLVFKDYGEAVKEHEKDRFTQVRDTISNLCESGANSRKLRAYSKFEQEITDLFRVNPNHKLGQVYWNYRNGEQPLPGFKQPEPPAGVPLWAFRQIENLKLVRHFVNWWIDERQIDNGEFGGGLSDDGDMTHQFVGPAMMGVDTDKITRSIRKLMDAYYDQGMFTDGMITIQTDELHTYEDGLQVIPQDMSLNYGMPKVVERLMESAKAYERITGINKAGHRHFRSNFYGATKLADEGVWAYQFPLSYCILHSGMALVEFNGNPRAKKLLLEIADGVLAHRTKDERGRWTYPSSINFFTDEAKGPASGPVMHLFWAAYRWTGDEKYLQPFIDGGPGSYRSINANVMDILGERDSWGKDIASRTSPHSGSAYNKHLAWMVSGNKQYLETLYADQIEFATQRMYLNTEGQWWIDRVRVQSTELQRARLGGIAGWRGTFYPGQAVSWRFKAPADGEDVAILVPKASLDEIKVIAFNTLSSTVEAEMTTWDITPGTWEAAVGIDRDGDDIPDGDISRSELALERTKSMALSLAPGTTTILTLKLKQAGTPYWDRPDLGIGEGDVSVSGRTVTAVVHNLGAKNAKAARLILVGRDGAELASADIPPIEAPVDLVPKKVTLSLTMPSNAAKQGISLVIDGKQQEITTLNNRYEIR